jgi:DNA modification methylase
MPVPDVLDLHYSGNRNRLHPTQKPVEPLKTLIGTFTRPDGVVLDPLCGSGSTLAAAHELSSCYIGIDLDPGSPPHGAATSGRNAPKVCAKRPDPPDVRSLKAPRKILSRVEKCCQ